jgi:hypothetical protein
MLKINYLNNKYLQIKNMDKKIVLLLIIFFLLIGSVVGILFEKKFSHDQSDLIENQREENEEELNCEESQNGLVSSSSPEGIYQIDGTIVQIGNKFLIAEALFQPNQLPLPEEEIAEKQNIKIHISGETEIFLIKPIETILEESSESFERFVINFEDLEMNDHVLVSSEENIKDKEEFVAKEIQVIKKIEIITPEG